MTRYLDQAKAPIFQQDEALIMQMEHEKCLEMTFSLSAQIEPTLLTILHELTRHQLT